jgi:hypothetical protein
MFSITFTNLKDKVLKCYSADPTQHQIDSDFYGIFRCLVYRNELYLTHIIHADIKIIEIDKSKTIVIIDMNF